MTLGRLVGLLVLVLVLYAVISQPVQMASSTRDGMGHLMDAGTRMTQFMSELVTPGSASQISSVPAGGAATGDGSYAP